MSQIPDELGVMAIAQQPVCGEDTDPGRTLAIVQKQAEAYARELIGKGVCDNHSPNKPGDAHELGVVRSAWVSPDGHIMAYARLFGKTERGRALISKVMKGNYKGCSLGSRHFLNSGVKASSEPIEFTLCEEGAIPGSKTIVTCATANPDDTIVTTPVHVSRQMPDGSKIDALGVFVGEQYMVSRFGDAKEAEMSDPKPEQTQPAATAPAKTEPAAPAKPAAAPAKTEAEKTEPAVNLAEMQKELAEMRKQNAQLQQDHNRMRAQEAENARKLMMAKIGEAKPKMERVLAHLKTSSAPTEYATKLMAGLEVFLKQPELMLEANNYADCMLNVESVLLGMGTLPENKQPEKPAESSMDGPREIAVNAGLNAKGGWAEQEAAYQRAMAEKNAMIAKLQKETNEMTSAMQAAANKVAANNTQPLQWMEFAAQHDLSASQKRGRPEEVPKKDSVQVIESNASKRTKYESKDAISLYILKYQERNGKSDPASDVIETFASAGYVAGQEVDIEDAAKKGAQDQWTKNWMSFHSSFSTPMVSKEEARLHNLPMGGAIEYYSANKKAPSVQHALKCCPPIED